MELKLNKDAIVEGVFLLVIFFALMWAGNASLWDHTLDHGFPYGYLASDAFQDYALAEHVKEVGNYRYYSISSGGGYKDVVGQYVPILFTLPALFSYVSGLETYDSIYLIIFVFAAVSVLVMYLIIRQFNRNVAILSLPLSLFLFHGPFYVGFTWGQWGFLLGSYFLVATVFIITKLDLKFSFILFGLLLSADFLAHPSELAFVAGFSILYFAWKFFRKNLSKTEIKNYVIGFGIFIIIALYYIIIFRYTFFVSNTGGSIINLAHPQSYQWRPLYLSSFGLLYIPLLVGLLVSLLFIKKENVTAILLGWWMLALGLANYLGGVAGSRSFQTRFFWPVYLGIFIGVLIYFFVGFLPQKWRRISSFATAAILLLFIFNTYPEKFTTNGIMNEYNWESLTYIRDNASADAEILFMYSDVYTHKSPTRQTNKTNALMDIQDYVLSLQNNTLKRYYKVEVDAEASNSHPKWVSILKFEPRQSKSGVKDLCKFEYFVFDIMPKASYQPQLIQANNVLRVYMLQNFGEEVFNNQVVSIVKNKKLNGECMPSEGIKLRSDNA